MPEDLLDQVSEIVRLCADSDGILIADRAGMLKYVRSPLNFYYKSNDIVGKHILEVYPDLTEESSTILRVLRTGKPVYGERQELTNEKQQKVILEATTLPILVDGKVAGAVDSARFYVIGQRVVRGGTGSGLSTLERIITQDPAMQALKRRVEDVARLDSPVLIYGETGTGKELIAEALHSGGGRAGGPFVAQNCAAIPSNLLESIFFGTEKGSFTGAMDRKGLFEVADGGTLFLDEINSMDVTLQAKLLKALEEQKVRHVGGHRDIPFDVRLVAAMNEDPQTVLREKRIREDLYYRLSVIRFPLPPLRARAGDIPLLARYFIDKYNRMWRRNIHGVSPQVERMFQSYRWPGNIRELQNVIEGAFASTRTDVLTAEDVQDMLCTVSGPVWELQPEVALPPEGFSLSRALDDCERKLLIHAMRESASISEAARRLGISRQNLNYRLKKIGQQDFFR